MADFRVIHKTVYDYEETVNHCHNLGHLKPVNRPFQINKHTDIQIEPKPRVIKERTDYFGNHYYYFAVEVPHQRIEVKTVSELSISQPGYPVFDQAESCMDVRKILSESSKPADIEAAEFCYPSGFVPVNNELKEFADSFFQDGESILNAAMEMTLSIRNAFEYDPRATTIMTPLTDVMKNKKGVCQDFTHLAIAAIRSTGLAARYVSGYIETYPPEGKEKLRGSDATHAWFSVYCPSVGWVDFDPTNGKFLTDEYVTTAMGRDFADVSPLKGVLFGGGKHKLNVAVDVERLNS